MSGGIKNREILNKRFFEIFISNYLETALSMHFRNGSLPSRFSGKKEVEKRERGKNYLETAVFPLGLPACA